MAEHSLPEDISEWPKDPFRLLGVTHGVDPRTIKRAYVALIRTYKPEQFPEQFALIRAAFEQLQHGSPLHNFRQISGDDSSPPAKPDETTPPESPPETAPEASAADASCDLDLELDRPSSRGPAASEPDQTLNADDAWEMALQGDIEHARTHLERLALHATVDLDVYLKLYWLYKLYPEHAGPGLAFDWLQRALQRSGMRGPPFRLLCSELDCQPGIAISGSHRQLLYLTGSGNELQALLRHRWRALARCRAWSELRVDLAVLHQRYGFDVPVLYAQCVMLAIDHVFWSADDAATQLLETCLKELQSFPDVQLKLGEQLDRLDSLEQLRKQRAVTRIAGFQRAWLDVLRDGWLDMESDARPTCLRCLAEWAAEPSATLGKLTELGQRAPLALSLFHSVLTRIHSPINHSAPERVELVRVVVRDTFRQVTFVEYSETRGLILDFCVLNGFELFEVVPYLTFNNLHDAPQMQHVLNIIQNDLPLLVTILGLLVFWE